MKRKSKHFQVFQKAMLSCGVLFTGVFTFGFTEKASAHGYVESPASRSYLCKQGVNTNCGPIQYEPQSVEGPGSFPQLGPSDGQIAGAGHFPDLDVQTVDRWKKVTLSGGKNTFQWKLTAPHSTKEWKYYITKKDWDPNKPLSRSDLDLVPFYVKNDGGIRPGTTVIHEANVPTDRNGYHLILAVWEIADTGNAFYQVIDVNLVNNGVTDSAHQSSYLDLPSSHLFLGQQ
ncbi:lytic polysaccharide monooxygenase [Bacillus sp. XF8]|uniref:lytic polysaccharide monooxygenase n=1 Tax=Bacillus sp. XF8 TaxID=2819289 RepID=UPI001AA09327|nr:lytic polysaccharide monooxygenase [Bacillus sp. XF8]MBO1582585.1 lytic polysaccharide monooxygenase [Bacillus sp. XF8]